MRALLRSAWPPALALSVLVVAWDLAANAAHASLSLPGPWLVLKSSWHDRGDLGAAMWTTTQEALLGIALAIACAVILAIAIDWSQTARRSIYPLMILSQTVPLIALAPLVVIWFGFGEAPKVALVALFTFFAISVGMVQGLNSADLDTMNLLRTMGASRRQILWRVRLPSALPQFFTGLKIGVTFSYVAAIFAEYVGAYGGLGYYMNVASHAFNTDLVFGAMIVTAVLTLALFGIVTALERAVIRWRPREGLEGSW
ncbi:MAG TPA: ABC transporter permease [Solirubrobacteraceae bacterium]|nr:ABC transporter permease [Solirubrobacteraceae bacterium]